VLRCGAVKLWRTEFLLASDVCVLSTSLCTAPAQAIPYSVPVGEYGAGYGTVPGYAPGTVPGYAPVPASGPPTTASYLYAAPAGSYGPGPGYGAV
jgi:hypothetical protein